MAPPPAPAPVFAGASRYVVAATLLACGFTQGVAQVLELEEDDPATLVVAALVALIRRSSRRLAWIGGGCMIMALTGLARVLAANRRAATGPAGLSPSSPTASGRFST